MTSLENLENETRPRKTSKRVGRGVGSGKGKTCGRGEKGAGSRSGYTRRLGYEGGQMRLFMKLPIRGFSNARFRKQIESINLAQIDAMYEDGEVVNAATLIDKGFLSGKVHAVKVLGDGELSKKVSFEVNALSASAKQKLENLNVAVTILN